MSGHVEAAAKATPGSVVGAALRELGELSPEEQKQVLEFMQHCRRERALDSSPLGELARRQILAFSDSALKNAGADGVVPTPLDAVAASAGITEIIDISQLPPDIAARKPPAMKTDPRRPAPPRACRAGGPEPARARARLTEAHEIGHGSSPGTGPRSSSTTRNDCSATRGTSSSGRRTSPAGTSLPG